MAAMNDNGSALYCICKSEYREDEFMIECDKCKDWFHGRCVSIDERESQYIDVYHCPSCVKQHGPLTLKRKRVTQKHNYLDLNHGIKPIYTGTMDFIRLLKARKFADVKKNVIVFENGYFLTHNYFETNGFKQPVLVEKSEGLNIVVPPENFTVYDVEQHVGSLHEIHVIDVAKQEDMRMRMREWTEYYNCPIRTKVLNVISLEFSNTKLSQMVSPPSIVRDISWVENVWPEKLDNESPHTMPFVQKYCLMGVKDCYTDFHVDFGGTSVWYHVLRGEKIFYLIEPTDENLAKYENWVSSSNQSQIFFGDRVSKCIRCSVKQGQTLFIPTGWIHAVMTPVDTLVFGGNFLHSLNIGLQLKIYDLEQRLNTPIKFLFPNYETTCWYTSKAILKKIKGIHSEGKKLPNFLFRGLIEMIRYLKMWTYNKEEYIKFHKFQVPVDISPLKLIKTLEKEVKYDMGMEMVQLGNESNMMASVMSDIKNAGSKNGKRGKRMSKTVIKLKLTGPNPNVENDPVSEKELKKPKKKRFDGGKKKKTKQHTNVTEGVTRKEKKGKETSKMEKKMFNEERHKKGIEKVHFQDVNRKSISDPPMTENHCKPLASDSEMHHGDASQFSMSSSHTDSMKLEYQDWEAAQLLSNFHGMDTRMRNEETRDSVNIVTPRDDIDAVKNDVFGKNINVASFDSKKRADEDDSDGGYRIALPLRKPKGSVKKIRSESDTDYDPSEEYYQDANYVYPRLESTADLDDDDFAWNPSQRKRKKSKKITNQTSKLNSQSGKRKRDDFFDEINENFEDEVTKANKLQNKSSNFPTRQEHEKKKDRFKRGQTTAKQRLGKLLKMDKLGGRYVR